MLFSFAYLACGSQKLGFASTLAGSVFESRLWGFVSRWVDRSSRCRLLRAGASGTRGRRPTGCRFENRSGSLRSEFVLVKQTAESVAPTDTPLVVSRRDGPDPRERRLLVERAV